jgi:uncharacterized protein YecT (DUF1311 family)
MRAIAAAAMIVTMTAAASADPVLECSGGAASQVQIGECLARTEAVADQAMAAALEIARAAAGEVDTATGRAGVRPALDAAQAAFLAYRDKSCEAVGAAFGGGSGTGIAIRGCRIAMTRDRTDALIRFGR